MPRTPSGYQVIVSHKTGIALWRRTPKGPGSMVEIGRIRYCPVFGGYRATTPDGNRVLSWAYTRQGEAADALIAVYAEPPTTPATLVCQVTRTADGYTHTYTEADN